MFFYYHARSPVPKKKESKLREIHSNAQKLAHAAATIPPRQHLVAHQPTSCLLSENRGYIYYRETLRAPRPIRSKIDTTTLDSLVSDLIVKTALRPLFHTTHVYMYACLYTCSCFFVSQGGSERLWRRALHPCGDAVHTASPEDASDGCAQKLHRAHPGHLQGPRDDPLWSPVSGVGSSSLFVVGGWVVLGFRPFVFPVALAEPSRDKN